MSENYPLDQKVLLKQVSEGSEPAFRKLFDTYRGKLYTYIFKITRSKETAEDTVHDVFMKVWVNREKLTQIQNPNAYLYRMAHNRAYNGFRRMASETVMIAELENQYTREDSDPEDKLIRKQVRQYINDSINHLTPQQKEVFRMSREDGLKQAEIAERLNISILTVKKHLQDAMIFLRKEISHNYDAQSVALFVICYLSL